MLELRGIRLGVVCGGKDLQEFSVAEDNEKTISCVIASEAGKTFHFSLENTLPQHSITAIVHMDGDQIESHLCGSASTRICNGVITNEYETRPYQFSMVQTTDDDSIAHPGDRISQHLGVMEIKIRRCHQKERKLANPKIPPSFGVVHERSKKAGVHRVSLGESSKESRQRYRCTVDYIDGGEEPYATFIFRYKPEDVLIAQGIMPHPPPTNEQDSEDARPRKRQRTENAADGSDSGVELVPGSDDEDPELEALKKQLAQLQKRVARRVAAKRTKKQLDRAIKQEMLKEEELDDAVAVAESSIIDLTSD